MKCYQRFIKYVGIDTKSNPNSKTHPSSKGQLKLAEILVKELKKMGINDVKMNEYGYVYCSILSNIAKKVDTIGFIAHMDTSPDISGANIKPIIIEDYNGENIVLNKEKNIIMDVERFPFLKDRKGESLIVTDGTTLLGADNKAGVAEIMTMVETIINNPDIKHGTIKIAFTPDEEIGEGTMFFDVEGFNCDYAFTVDGGPEGSVEYENFNAASAIVTIYGINIHPGSAKGQMLNSIDLAFEFDNLLPKFLKPAFTEKYEGFNHLSDIKGNVEKTELNYIIRNHDINLFKKQKEDFNLICNFLNKKYGSDTCKIKIKDSYYNMYEYIKDKMDVINIAKKAIKKTGITPIIEPIRGGTDGAMLTYKGLICPNLGTGGYNFHGRFECITIEGMDRSLEIILNIIQEVVNK